MPQEGTPLKSGGRASGRTRSSFEDVMRAGSYPIAARHNCMSNRPRGSK